MLTPATQHNTIHVPGRDNSYQVLEFEPGRKLVLSGLSEHHATVDQFVFMPDNADAGMTVRAQSGCWGLQRGGGPQAVRHSTHAHLQSHACSHTHQHTLNTLPHALA